MLHVVPDAIFDSKVKLISFGGAIVFAGTLMSLLCTNLACADEPGHSDLYPNGVGFILGEPTGLTIKHWIGPDRAIDGGLAYSFNDFVLVYSDYLWHFSSAFNSAANANDDFLRNLTPYLGVGGELFFSSSGRTNNDYYDRGGSSVGFGLRVPLGLEWSIPKTRLAAHLEIAPGIGLAPSTFGFVQGGVGIRYYF